MRLSRAAAASCAALAAAGGFAATSLAAPSGLIWTAAGTGSSGEGIGPAPATSLALRSPADVAAVPGGDVLVADTANNRIRRIDGADGTMAIVAGEGSAGFSGDGGSAALAKLKAPKGVAPLPGGGYLVADTGNDRIRKVVDGTITTVAGTGSHSYDGSAQPAAQADLDGPSAVSTTADGGYLVADTQHHAIRKVLNGVMTTVAGTGASGFTGDGGSATAARLSAPTDAIELPSGDLVIADTGNDRVRRVAAATGTITTVAGGGVGPAGSATALTLDTPAALAPAGDDGFVLSDAGLHRVGHILKSGAYHVLAGTGTAGAGGEGVAGASAPLHSPRGVAVDASGQLIIADEGNHRVRRLDVDLRPPAPVQTTPTDPPPPATTPTDPPPPATTPTDPPPPATTPVDPPPPATTPTDPPAPATTPQDPPPPATTPTTPAEPAPAGETPATERVEPVRKTSDPVAPELGRLVVVAPASGQVLVRRPGATAATPLEAGEEIPVGSVVDARRGTVRLTSALTGSRVQTGRFWGAEFAVGQSRGGDGTTDLTLRGGSFAGCPRAGAARTAAKRKPARRLWGDDKGGKFRTRGRSSVATVRGTRWLTEDTCAGTLTRVVEGAVDVRDLRRGTVRRVRAGQTLLVRATGR